MIKQIPGRSIFLDDETIFAELICDTITELAGVTELDGTVLSFGSVAYAVRDAAFYVLDSSGTWHSSADSSEPEDPETASKLNLSPLTADLSAAKLTSQPLDTAESEVIADDLNVGSAESE